MRQTELHRHLDVSARLSTMLELAQERGLEGESTSLEAFGKKLVIREPMSDLNTVLAQFTLYQQVLDRPDVLARVALEAVEDCRNEGTRRVEFRFSPGWLCELSKLKWEDALDGFEEGLSRAREQFPDVQTGLICIASRDFGVQGAEKTVEFFLKHQERFIGIDLAGNETDFPCSIFYKPFLRAKDHGARITIHSGEAAGPENIWEAINDLGAERIGHGIHCVKDPELMRTLRDRSICLEICPTSNWLTRSVDRLQDHPLKAILRAGIPVTINTDDPGIFGLTLPHEIDVSKKQIGLSEAEVRQCFEYADRFSFLPRV